MRDLAMQVFEFLRPAIDLLISNFRILISTLVDFYNKNQSWIIPTIQFIAQVIGAILVGAIWVAITGISNSIAQIIGFINWVQSAIIWVQNFANWVSNLANQFFSFNLFAAGQQLIQGFMNGVNSMAQSLINSVTRPINDAINGAKNLLEIQSPSKVFEQIGKYTMEGLGIGIDKNSDQPIQSVSRVANNLGNQNETNFVGKSVSNSGSSPISIIINMGGNFMGTSKDRREFIDSIENELRDRLPKILAT
jgi:hypothetical protein